MAERWLGRSLWPGWAGTEGEGREPVALQGNCGKRAFVFLKDVSNFSVIIGRAEGTSEKRGCLSSI